MPSLNPSWSADYNPDLNLLGEPFPTDGLPATSFSAVLADGEYIENWVAARKAEGCKLHLFPASLNSSRAGFNTAIVDRDYRGVAEALLATGLEPGMTYEYLDGRTRDRAKKVERFQSDPTCPLFLISLKAGGTGLNLTAASHVVHFDRWWNPAVENQATDRAYRIGQTRAVQVHRLLTRNTFEERINDMIRAKRGLADMTVGTGEQWIGQLSDRACTNCLRWGWTEGAIRGDDAGNIVVGDRGRRCGVGGAVNGIWRFDGRAAGAIVGNPGLRQAPASTMRPLGGSRHASPLNMKWSDLRWPRKR